MSYRTAPLSMMLLLAVVVGVGCGPRARTNYGPPDIRRVTGVGVMHLAPAPAPPPPAYVPPAPAPDVNLAGVVTVEGFGVPPAGMAPSQGKLMARRAAISDARRNMLETVKGVAVTSGTTVQNFVTQNDTIRTQVDGYIQGAQVIDEDQAADGTVRVVMQLDLAGLNPIIQPHVGSPAPMPPQAPAHVGVAPAGGPAQAQARAMARRAAQMDAQRQLLEMAKGIRIDSNTTVQDFMLRNDSIRSRIEGIIRGAREVDTRYLPDGTVEVVMEFDMNLVRYNVR